jgi:hypothetical protein
VAGALSRLTGKHVEIGAIAFRPGADLEVRIERLRVLDAAGSDAPPLLEIEHAVGRQAWPRLLAGQLLPLDWKLEKPVLRLKAAGEDADGMDFDLTSLPRMGLSLADGEISYQPARGEPWVLRALKLEARRVAFGLRVEGEATGRLARGDTAIGELDVDYSADRSDIEARGSVAALDLSALPQDALPARGVANGRFDLAYVFSDGDVKGKLDLAFSKLSLRVPDLAPIAPASARLGLDVDWQGNVLTLGLRPLALDDLVAVGSVIYDASSPGRIAVDVKLDPFEPGRRDRLNALTLLGLKIDTWRTVAENIQAGVVEDAHLVIDVPRTTAGARLAFDAPLEPEAFSLTLRARDGIYQPSPDTRLENLSGELEIRGNVMSIRKLRMHDDGEPSPEIDVRLDGLDRLIGLPTNEDEVVGGPETDLVGLAAAVDGLSGDDEDGSEPTAVAFSELDLRYPAFVLPLREASGTLQFPAGGILAEDVRGILGGAPAEFDVRWDPAADKIAVDIRYLAGIASGQPTSGPRWLSARIALDSLDVGDLTLARVNSRIAATGAEVSFSEIEAQLSGGAVTGSGEVSLARAESAPFAFTLEVVGFDAAPLAGVFGLPGESVTGIGHAKGRIGGVLSRESRFVRDGDLDIGIALKDGEVSKLPALVALARLPSLSGVSGLLGQPLPYDSLVIDFKLEKGRLGLADGKLLGPQLRMLGSGEMDLTTPEKHSDIVIALLFLQTLDSMIGSLPLVRNVVLGKDRNLLALYFRLDGPRDDMRVTPLAPESVRNIVGFASSAVMTGIRTLGRLIPGTGGEDAEEPAPAPEPVPESP